MAGSLGLAFHLRMWLRYLDMRLASVHLATARDASALQLSKDAGHESFLCASVEHVLAVASQCHYWLA
jgi:hypothetical protein